MGLRNLLIVVLLAWGGMVLWRRWRAAARAARRSQRMVRCEDCGVYVPIGEAVARGGERYVCASHSRSHRA